MRWQTNVQIRAARSYYGWSSERCVKKENEGGIKYVQRVGTELQMEICGTDSCEDEQCPRSSPDVHARGSSGA